MAYAPEDTPLSINPFYKQWVKGSDLYSDSSSKTLAIFALAHEVATLRQTIEKGMKEIGNDLTAIGTIVRKAH